MTHIAARNALEIARLTSSTHHSRFNQETRIMRTTVELEDDLYLKALEIADPNMDEAELIQEALKTFIRIQAGRRLLALCGQSPDMQPIK